MKPSENVSRETLQRLETYAETLRKWNPKINLVSKSTIDTLWERHIEDSLQLLARIPRGTQNIVDMGSGGGFPGLVLAIAAMDFEQPTKVTLIESDQRKSAFLRTVLRETGAFGEIITDRIERVEPLGAEVLTARALADLPQLLDYSERHLKKDGTALFLKGKTWKEEVEFARKIWTFNLSVIDSQTNEDAVLLEIGEINRV